MYAERLRGVRPRRSRWKRISLNIRGLSAATMLFIRRLTLLKDRRDFEFRKERIFRRIRRGDLGSLLSPCGGCEAIMPSRLVEGFTIVEGLVLPLAFSLPYILILCLLSYTGRFQ